MRLTLTVLSVLLVIPVASSAGVVRVPDDFDRVAAALYAAEPYDTVLVAPGVHPVNVEWPDTPGLKLVSEAGPEVTILDGGDKVQVIGIYTGADTTTVVSGFTIRKGRAEGV